MIATRNQTARARRPETVFANIEIEKAVLASFVAGGRELLDELGGTIDSQLFHFSQSQKILTAISELYAEGAPIDLQIVTERLRDHRTLEVCGGAATITALGIDGNRAPEVARYNIELLRDLYAQRQARRIAERILNCEIAPDVAAKELAKLSERRETNKPLIEFRSPLQLERYTEPPGIVLVGDFQIVKGNVIVEAGPPGVGKSRAATALAEAGATGRTWFGLTVHRKFKTMIVQTENGEFRLAREFRELNCDALENFVRVCPPPPYGLCFRRDGFREQLAAAIAEFMPDVVVFDPWNAVAREQDSKEYLDTFDALKSVLPCGDDAPALFIVAHTRKPRHDERASGRALLNLVAGSYVLGSVPRTVFVMQAASDDPTDDRVVWTCCKNNDGELGARSAWERRNGLFAPVIDFDWKAFDTPDRDRRQMIGETELAEVFADGPLTKTAAAKRLQENTGVSKATAYRALDLNGRFRKRLRLENGLWNWK